VLENNRARQVAFFAEMSATLGMLEQIARGELRGEAQSDVQRDFLRRMFDDSAQLKFGSAQVPDYSGWYCGLFYARHKDPTGLKSKPVVADVHTNPNDQEALEVGTGDARLLVIAIEGQSDQTVYVGPVFSYYEFWQPAEQRLNDDEWRRLLATGSAPPEPEWVHAFAVKPTARAPEDPRVTVTRQGDSWSIQTVRAMQGTTTQSFPATAWGLPMVVQEGNVHALDLSNTDVDDQSLRSLSRLPDLRSLDLSTTKITDAGIAALREQRHLQSLDVSATAITDAALDVLVNLPYLSQLDLRETGVTEGAVRELRRRMPHTEVDY
jgi:hypothetical protein